MFGKAFGEDDSIHRAATPTFDVQTGELRAGRQAVRLEPKAAAVLHELRAGNNEVVSRDALLDCCWEPGAGSDEALTQAVAQIRRGFTEIGVAPPVETLAKRGYRLTANIGDPRKRLERVGSAKRFPSILMIGMAALALLAIAWSHPARHAFRHALGWGPPVDGATAEPHAS